MFINRDALFNITFFVKVIRNFKLHIIEEEELQKLPASAQDKYEEVNLTLKPLSWGGHCSIRRSAIRTNPDTQMKEWDNETYMDEKLKKILYSWSFTEKNAEGHEIPVEINDASINRLHPALADFILSKYDTETEVTKEDLKNF